MELHEKIEEIVSDGYEISFAPDGCGVSLMKPTRPARHTRVTLRGEHKKHGQFFTQRVFPNDMWANQGHMARVLNIVHEQARAMERKGPNKPEEMSNG